MIKVIAFDLVGVLVREKDIEMTIEEQKLERLFGPNKSDDEYLKEASKIITDDNLVMETTANILNNLYEVKDSKLFEKIRNKYPNIKIVIATNHLSKIRHFIINELDSFNIDEIFISADINKIKPFPDFYNYIVNKLNSKPEEILFLDDNQDNIDGAIKCGLNTIKVNKNMDLFEEIEIWLSINNKL